jgi:hypothetical protein
LALSQNKNGFILFFFKKKRSKTPNISFGVWDYAQLTLKELALVSVPAAEIIIFELYGPNEVPVQSALTYIVILANPVLNHMNE